MNKYSIILFFVWLKSYVKKRNETKIRAISFTDSLTVRFLNQVFIICKFLQCYGTVFRKTDSITWNYQHHEFDPNFRPLKQV